MSQCTPQYNNKKRRKKEKKKEKNFILLLFCFVCSFFVAGCHYLAQASLEIIILLPLPPKFWDYKYVLPCLANIF
jgi:hypothetical protein